MLYSVDAFDMTPCMRIGVMGAKAAFFLDAVRLLVTVKVAAPDLFEFKLLKTTTQQCLGSIGHKPLTPKRDANPVSELCFEGREIQIAGLSAH